MSTDYNTPRVQAQNVSKRVITSEGPLTLLENINLSIGAGEAVAVVGASGSGKSTLLGLLAGLDVPSSGQIFLDGVELNRLDEDGRARLRAGRIGFVFQSFQLMPGLTALENIMLPLELAGDASARAIAQDVLQRVGLGARLQHYPTQLSGGEQQRVAIARAFAIRPAVLFADEPTGSLDQATGERVIELLFSLNKELHSTLVLVTHDLELGKYCHRRLLLDAGRLQESTEKSESHA